MGIAQLSESFVRDRQIYLTRRADALAQPDKQRDLDAAAGPDATAHGKVPAVRDFLERTRGLVEA